jgi:hypothetical protein
MSNNKTSKASRQDAIRKVLAGWTKYFGNVAQVVLAGTDFTPASLQQFLLADIATSDAADQQKGAWMKSVQLERASRTNTDPVLRAIRSLVLSQYGDTKQANDVFAVFGYSPRTRRKAKTADKAKAAEKAVATREARGVTGKRKRAGIKGNVPATSPAGQPVTKA